MAIPLASTRIINKVDPENAEDFLAEMERKYPKK
jgi:hypothetical protein